VHGLQISALQPADRAPDRLHRPSKTSHKMPQYGPFNAMIYDPRTNEYFDEYNVVQIDEKTIECYIESTIGRNFGLRFVLDESFRDIASACRVGFSVNGSMIRKHTLGQTPDGFCYSRHFDNVKLSKSIVRPLVFSATNFKGNFSLFVLLVTHAIDRPCRGRRREWKRSWRALCPNLESKKRS
jgi:hypothetical protein